MSLVNVESKVMSEILLQSHGAIRHEIYLSEILTEKFILQASLDNNGNLFHFDVYFMFIIQRKQNNIFWCGNSLFLMFTNMKFSTY